MLQLGLFSHWYLFPSLCKLISGGLALLHQPPVQARPQAHPSVCDLRSWRSTALPTLTAQDLCMMAAGL